MVESSARSRRQGTYTQVTAILCWNTNRKPLTRENGSLVRADEVGCLAQAGGMPVWHGSGNDLGTVGVASTHSCAVAPNRTLSRDILGLSREDHLVVTPIGIKDGYPSTAQQPRPMRRVGRRPSVGPPHLRMNRKQIRELTVLRFWGEVQILEWPR